MYLWFSMKKKKHLKEDMYQDFFHLPPLTLLKLFQIASPGKFRLWRQTSSTLTIVHSCWFGRHKNSEQIISKHFFLREAAKYLLKFLWGAKLGKNRICINVHVIFPLSLTWVNSHYVPGAWLCAGDTRPKFTITHRVRSEGGGPT